MGASLRAGRDWLAAATVEVIELRPRAGAARGAPAGSEPAGQQALPGALERWSTRMQRWRALVLVRRHLLVALALAIALQLANLLAGLSELALLAAPCVLLVGVAIELPRAPGSMQLAWLLDERIGLHDLLGTGVELQARPATEMRPLERRALAQAGVEASRSLAGWCARPAPAGGEWSTLAVALAVLAALVLAVPSHGGARHAHPAPASKRASASQRSSRQHAAPAPAHRPGATPATKAPRRAPAAATAPRSLTQPVGATRSGSHAPAPAAAPTHAGAKPGAAGAAGRLALTPVAGAKAGAGSPTGAFKSKATGVSPVAPPRLLAGASPAGTRTSTAGAAVPSRSPSRAPTGAQRSAGAQRGAGAGRPAGSAGAGHERGSTQLGGSHALSGSATRALPLQAGYASSKPSSAGAARSGEAPGHGGGHGRSREVGAGASAGAAGAPTYVPGEGGSAAGAGGSLLISYLSRLERAQEESW